MVHLRHGQYNCDISHSIHVLTDNIKGNDDENSASQRKLCCWKRRSHIMFVLGPGQRAAATSTHANVCAVHICVSGVEEI